MGTLHILCLCVATMLLARCQDPVPDPDQTPALEPEEKFQDMFPLIGENFTEKVLRNKDPWIVIFHDGTMERAWKTMATHLRGLCWIGMVDTRDSETLLKEIGYKKNDTGARVYPFGDKRTKERKWSRASTPNEARSLAVSSLPDKTTLLAVSGLQDFLIECFTVKPSRFPVYLVTEENEASVLWKALAIRFEKYFSFARIYKPTGEDLKAFGLEKFFIDPPALFVLVADEGNLEKMNAVHFDKSKQGQFNYTNVMTFLFAINSEFRFKLPGENQSNQKTEAEMEDIVQIEAQRFEVQSQSDNESPKDGSGEAPTAENVQKIRFSATSELREEL